MFDVVEEMHNQRIFLEIAIPTAFAIIPIDEYQIINSILIWYNRIFMVNYLKNSFNYLCVNPIKHTNLGLRESV